MLTATCLCRKEISKNITKKAEELAIFICIKFEFNAAFYELLSLLLLTCRPCFSPKWSYPLHGHVRDANTHVSTAGPRQKMSR